MEWKSFFKPSFGKIAVSIIGTILMMILSIALMDYVPTDNFRIFVYIISFLLSPINYLFSIFYDKLNLFGTIIDNWLFLIGSLSLLIWYYFIGCLIFYFINKNKRKSKVKIDFKIRGLIIGIVIGLFFAVGQLIGFAYFTYYIFLGFLFGNIFGGLLGIIFMAIVGGIYGYLIGWLYEKIKIK